MKKLIATVTGLKRLRLPVIILVLGTILYGCYVIREIRQPTVGDPNSSFAVDIVLDPNPGDDYTGGSLKGVGLFGVLLPQGWTIEDNIEYHLVSENEQYTTSGTLSFNADQGAALTAKVAPPSGYYWWGAKSKTELDMHFFDSLYFTINVLTDDKLGTFKLKYAFGDTENAERIPLRTGAVSNDYAIKIGLITATEETEASAFKAYPNPTEGKFTVDYTNESAGIQREMRIFNANGQCVNSAMIHHGSNSFDLSGSPRGTYFLTIEDKGKRRTQKVLLR
jgi:hypothetical protein